MISQLRLLIVCCATVLAGCGGPCMAKVTVKITRNGESLLKEGKGILAVELYPYIEGKEVLPDTFRGVSTAPDTFVVKGKKGKGIPCGKYRIGVQHLVDVEKRGRDLLEKKYGPRNSPIIREFHSNADIVIDLARPEG